MSNFQGHPSHNGNMIGSVINNGHLGFGGANSGNGAVGSKGSNNLVPEILRTDPD